MKNTYSHTTAVVAIAVLLGLVCTSHLSADPSSIVHIGLQPPPSPRKEIQWASPAQTAVWIAGHNEWSEGHYIWLGGYYTYPPNKNAKWMPTRYSHSQEGYSYHPGHWSQAAGKPSPKGIDSSSATYIHPVLQDNGVGNGDREVKNGLKRARQADYHQMQTN